MQDVMLDLETMGNGPNAAIIAIGAVEFDIERKLLGAKFYEVVDLQSSVDTGGEMDASTVLWWMKQSDEARNAFARKGGSINEILLRFQSWIDLVGDRADVRMWGNGAAFDNVILASAFRRSGLDVPWKFWNDRCYRTIKAMHPDVRMERSGTYHNALDDAVNQANHLMKMLNKNELSNDCQSGTGRTRPPGPLDRPLKNEVLERECTLTTSRDEAVKFLLRFLGKGGQSLRLCKEEAAKNGISVRTLYRARCELKIERKVSGFGPDKSSIWSLPDRA